MADLKSHDHLVEISEEVDPNLQVAEIHRRIYEAGGPAIHFLHIKGSPFQAVSNIYGTHDRVDFLFRKTMADVKKVVQLKADPSLLLKRPLHYLSTPFTALKALPRKRFSQNWQETQLDQLPQIKSWPDDGGAFITLPQVFTLPPGEKSMMKSNLGMYRIQISGNEYEVNKEVGMHYQLHRGIGVHHTQYLNSDEPFRVSIFIGGAPSHALAAIFPLPEGLSELTFAGMLAGKRFQYEKKNGFYLSSAADFIITGTIAKSQKKKEGPFGDHLGYYSLAHDFPVMQVDKVYHRKDPIWHFTVVGRPPQEDSGFGYLIHQLIGPLLPSEFPGIKEIHAVDVAGVHPLLLAVGSERYMPFRQSQPEEILTQANHILGSGQTSLAKYLWIAATDGDASWSASDINSFFTHVLERVDWRRDLHFQTKTTIDTLDYSGSGWNAGSKLVVACCGDPIRSLGTALRPGLKLTELISQVKIMGRGILVLEGRPFVDYSQASSDIEALTNCLHDQDLHEFPLLVIVDDAAFVHAHFDNFLWVTFTRSNPSHDIYGVGSFTEHKHWGCTGSLVIDARIKPHHAPVLEVDKKTKEKVDRLFAAGGSLSGLGI